jgi:hypothetical protein
MTPDLDRWLRQATRSLSNESAAQVRAEIQEHYESAREAAIIGGASPDEADRMALSVLGDAKIANTQYRRVLLTAFEAKMLSQSNQGTWVARPLSWGHWLLLAISVIAVFAAVTLFRTGWIAPGRTALAFGLGIEFMILAPRLPVYTASRARLFRGVRWMVQAGLWIVAFGPGALTSYWLLILLICQLVWTEWKRAVIRRKLPVSDWPRQLYL